METKNKKCRIIMLPTDVKTDVVKIYTEVDRKNFILKFKAQVNDNYKEYQHLHIISDDEIREGDWFITNNKHVEKAPKARNLDLLLKGNNCKKIIATTDKSLVQKKKIIGKDEIGNLYNNIYLPQPSKAFIEKYCKIGGVDEVMVEYITQFTGNYTLKDKKSNLTWEPKINSHNEIIIHSIKNSCNKKELNKLILDRKNHLKSKLAEAKYRKLTKVNDELEILKLESKISELNWIKENL